MNVIAIAELVHTNAPIVTEYLRLTTQPLRVKSLEYTVSCVELSVKNGQLVVQLPPVYYDCTDSIVGVALQAGVQINVPGTKKLH